MIQIRRPMGRILANALSIAFLVFATERCEAPKPRVVGPRRKVAPEVQQLFGALRDGDTENVERLLARGVSIHARYLHGETPLHAAALYGRCKEIELLLRQGAHIDAKADSGETPLHCAAMNCRTAAARILVARGANVDARSRTAATPLLYAARGGSLEFVEFLLANGARIPTTGGTPLHGVCGGGSVGGRGDEAERLALAQLFLDKGVRVNAKGCGPWSDGNRGATPLHCAASSAGRRLVEFLIGKGAEVNARDTTGYTPLHYAAAGGNKETAEVLVARGADVHATTGHSGNTPLHLAVQLNNVAGPGGGKRRVELVRLLLDHGADVNARNSREHTALHIAVAWGWDSLETVQALLSSGADVHARDRSGRTPLALAKSSQRKPAIQRLLLEHGAKE